MTERKPDMKPMPVPSSRFVRAAKLGGLASSIAGSVMAEGAKSLARGQRPVMSDLLLTPQNALKVADKLAQMRGAAMKMGQLMSMDAGEGNPALMRCAISRKLSAVGSDATVCGV